MIKTIVIEDYEDIRLEMVKMLSSFNFISVIFNTGNPLEAEQYLGKNEVDLVISDIMLPDEDNTIFHLLDKLLEKGKQMPHVILFSGKAQDYHKHALNNRAIVLACLDKPVELDALSVAVHKAQEEIEEFPAAVNKRKLSNKDFIFIRYKGGGKQPPGQWFLKINSIKYIQSEGANVSIVYSKKIQQTEIIYKSGEPQKNGYHYVYEDDTARYFIGLGEVQERLDSKLFIRVNQGSIINVNYIEKIDIKDNEILIHLFGGYKFELKGESKILDFKSYFKL